MNEHNMATAFPAAGVYTLERLEHGAAAKPHSILDKSIKPAEIGLADDFPALSLADADKSLLHTNFKKVSLHPPRHMWYTLSRLRKRLRAPSVL